MVCFTFRLSNRSVIIDLTVIFLMGHANVTESSVLCFLEKFPKIPLKKQDGTRVYWGFLLVFTTEDQFLP